MIETSPQHNDALFQTAADPGARLLPRSGGLPGVHNRLNATDPATRELRFAPGTSPRLPRQKTSAPADDGGVERKLTEEARSVAQEGSQEEVTTDDSSTDSDSRCEVLSGPDAELPTDATASQTARVRHNLHDAESVSLAALATEEPGDAAHPAEPSPVQALRSLIKSARSTVLATELQIATEADDSALPNPDSEQRVDAPQPSSGETSPRKLNRGLNRLTPKTDPLSQKLRRKLERIREKKGLAATDASPAPASARKSKDYVGRRAPKIPQDQTVLETSAASDPTTETARVPEQPSAQRKSDSQIRKRNKATAELPKKTRSGSKTKSTTAAAAKQPASEKRRHKSADSIGTQATTATSEDAVYTGGKSASSDRMPSERSSEKRKQKPAKSAVSWLPSPKNSAIAAVAKTSGDQPTDVQRVTDQHVSAERSTKDETRTSAASADSEVRAAVLPPTGNDSDVAGPMFVDLQQFTESRIDVTFLSCHQTDHHFSAPSPAAASMPQPPRIVTAPNPAATQHPPAQHLATAEKRQSEIEKEEEPHTEEAQADDESTDNLLADEVETAFDSADQRQLQKLRAHEEARRVAKRVGTKISSTKVASAKTEPSKSSSQKTTSPKTAFAAFEFPTEEKSRPANKQNRTAPSERSNQPRSRRTAAGLAALTLVEPAPVPVEPYSEWFKRVVLRNRGMMLFTTFYLHWLVLLLLAAIIVHAPENTAALLITATFSNDEPQTEAFEVITTEPEPILEEESVPAPEPLTTERVAEMEERELEIDDSFLDNLHPDSMQAASNQATQSSSDAPSDSSNTSNPHQYQDSSPAQAIREGSFSVWTDPPHPKPGESYRLIIQVKLPPHVHSYSVTDLQGVVVGSDGYRKPIPGFMKGDLPIVDGYVRLAVPIVSADKKVCDTVFIRSKLLRETQKLLVEFL